MFHQFSDHINKADVLILHINEEVAIFRDIFSKLEMVTALGFLDAASKKFSIPSVFMHVSAPHNDDKSLEEYLQLKEKRRKDRKTGPSALDNKFENQFLKYADMVSSMDVASHDIFTDSDVCKLIEGSGRKILFFAGFFTELDILRSSASALDRGYIPFVISDATSTYSERIYYEALDIISQYNEVIDTRDLGKVWPEALE